MSTPEQDDLLQQCIRNILAVFYETGHHFMEATVMGSDGKLGLVVVAIGDEPVSKLKQFLADSVAHGDALLTATYKGRVN